MRSGPGRRGWTNWRDHAVSSSCQRRTPPATFSKRCTWSGNGPLSFLALPTPMWFELGVADKLLVRLVLAQRVVTELEVGYEVSVDVEAGAETGAEGQDDLHTFGIDDAVPNDPWESDAHSVERLLGGHHLVDHRHDCCGGRRLGVSSRWRVASARPSSSIGSSLMPVPPISMVSVLIGPRSITTPAATRYEETVPGGRLSAGRYGRQRRRAGPGSGSAATRPFDSCRSREPGGHTGDRNAGLLCHPDDVAPGVLPRLDALAKFIVEQ